MVSPQGIDTSTGRLLAFHGIDTSPGALLTPQGIDTTTGGLLTPRVSIHLLVLIIHQ
jgi:hypothetical protein